MSCRRISKKEHTSDDGVDTSRNFRFWTFRVAKIRVNPAIRYLRIDIPSLYLFAYRKFCLTLDGEQIASGSLWNYFTFIHPHRISISIPIRGFETLTDAYLISLTKADRSLLLKTNVKWVLGGKFRHISQGEVEKYNWQLKGSLETIRQENTTPWELLQVNTKRRKRLVVGSSKSMKRFIKLEKDSKISSGERILFLGNSKSVEFSRLENLPKSLNLVAFNRFARSSARHSFRENLLVSADKRMILDYGDEIRQGASNALVLLSSAFRKERESSLGLRKQFVEKDVFRTDLGSPIQTFGSSPLVGLQICLSFTPKTIVFYGMDMTFPSYPVQSSTGRGLTSGEGNHFLPDYRGGKPWYQPHWERVLTGFFIFSLVSKEQGIKLFNVTPANHVPLRAENLKDIDLLGFW